MIATSALQGDFKKNPYNFARSFKGEDKGEVKGIVSTLIKADLTLNGNQLEGLNDIDTLEFQHLKNNLLLDNLLSGDTNSITVAESKDGYFFLTFDFTTALNSGAFTVLPRVRTGQVRLSLRFDNPLPYEVTVCAYSDYQSTLEIDVARSVKVNLF